jgi:hypothetical protein
MPPAWASGLRQRGYGVAETPAGEGVFGHVQVIQVTCQLADECSSWHGRRFALGSPPLGCRTSRRSPMAEISIPAAIPLGVATAIAFLAGEPPLGAEPLQPSSGVGLDELHDDHDLTVGTLRNRVPERQAVRRKMETIGAGQRISLRKGVCKRRHRLFEKMKDRLVRSVPKWLRQALNLIPGSVWEAKNPVTH